MPEMNMQTVKDLMKEVGWGTLATTDGRKVGVRPMGGWAWFGKELWCATFKSSDKVAQLNRVPYAEYCICHKDGLHARIAGPCTISMDNDDKLKLYKAVPALKEHIDDPGSRQYVVIRMRPDRIRVMSPPDEQYTEIEP